MISQGWMVSLKGLESKLVFLRSYLVPNSKILVVVLTFFHQVDTAGISSFFSLFFFSAHFSPCWCLFSQEKKKNASKHQEYKKKNDDVYLHTGMQVYFLQTHFSSENYPSILPKHNCCFWKFLSKKYLRQISILGAND